MILHHYTAAELMPSILRDGLWIGDVPTSATGGLNGVWLTTDPTPAGHGLTHARPMTAAERLHFLRWRGSDPGAGAMWADKRAFRIRVRVASRDRRLVRWTTWGRKHCEPRLFDGLNLSGCGKQATWWIYFGTIPPERFIEVRDLRDVGARDAA